jgi:hypothetical protein
MRTAAGMNVHGGSTLAPGLSLGEGEVGFPKADNAFASPWYQNIKIAFRASTGQMKTWLKHQKKRKEHRTRHS